jgi:hypothetical protein
MYETKVSHKQIIIYTKQVHYNQNRKLPRYVIQFYYYYEQIKTIILEVTDNHIRQYVLRTICGRVEAVQ